MSKPFLITQSLLNSWDYSFASEDGYKSFLDTLSKNAAKKTNAMLDGVNFENMITAHVEGAPINPEHKWSTGVEEIGNMLNGAVLQVKLSRNIIINNVEFVLYGILDALKFGVIYDIKFSKAYMSAKAKYGKYCTSPQHPMYFELCPGADKFVYLISDGKEVFREEYLRSDTPSIADEIKQFMKYLDERNLTDIYCENWRSKY